MTECLNMNIRTPVSNAACCEKVRVYAGRREYSVPVAGVGTSSGVVKTIRSRIVNVISIKAVADGLTDTVFEGHRQSLKILILCLLCLYLTGVNLSDQQTAPEPDLNPDDVQRMTRQLHEGADKKKRSVCPVRSDLMK